MYLLFAGNDYYPNGGWEDFGGSYETQEAAEAVADEWRSVVTVPYQPARKNVLYVGTGTGSLPERVDVPAKPEHDVVRYSRNWAHIVHEGEMVAEWSDYASPFSSPDSDWRPEWKQVG